MSMLSFRDAEHSGWTTRADSYADFATVTGQAIPFILGTFDDLIGRMFLDVCCGPGHLAAAASGEGATVEGVDFAPTMVALARRNHPGIPFREADAECLPHINAGFDAVACAFGLMHMQHPDRAISEAFRVLRSDGVFCFTQWAADDELLGIVGAAVTAHGDPAVAMPPAPPLMRFANPEECQRALLAQGFTDLLVKRIELVWQCARPEAVLDLIHGGAVRAAMLIDAQSSEDRERVQTAIVEAVRNRRTPEGRYLVRRPALLARGGKPKA